MPPAHNRAMDDDPLPRLRAIALALPDANERLSHGEPTFFAGRSKTFVMYANNHHDDGRIAFWCPAPDGFQRMLVEAEPDRFFVPPYVGFRGWIGVRLDVPVDWVEIATIVRTAYRMVAPKRLAARLDAGEADVTTPAPRR